MNDLLGQVRYWFAGDCFAICTACIEDTVTVCFFARDGGTYRVGPVRTWRDRFEGWDLLS